jgi:hypothetical protein
MGMDNNRTDQRKHVVQMSRFEADAMTNFVQSIRGWQGLNQMHITDRKAKWNVSDAEILNALRDGEIVEVHNNNAPEIRAVVRADIGFRSICVTVSLTNRCVVTMWVNNTNDNHFTLRAEEYQWKVNLMQVLSGFRTPQAV